MRMVLCCKNVGHTHSNATQASTASDDGVSPALVSLTPGAPIKEAQLPALPA